MFFWFLHFLQKKRTKTSRHVVKSNLFVRFLEETLAWKNHFEFVWPIGMEDLHFFWRTFWVFTQNLLRQCAEMSVSLQRGIASNLRQQRRLFSAKIMNAIYLASSQKSFYYLYLIFSIHSNLLWVSWEKEHKLVNKSESCHQPQTSFYVKCAFISIKNALKLFFWPALFKGVSIYKCYFCCNSRKIEITVTLCTSNFTIS